MANIEPQQPSTETPSGILTPLFEGGQAMTNRPLENSLNWMASSAFNVTKHEFTDLSDQITLMIYVINYSILCFGVCLFGIVSNVINIIVFIKQGFQETVSITFLAMAISDLASLITLLYLVISFNLFLLKAELSFYPTEVQVLFGGWPHVWFLRITAWLTAYVSLERCFCVIFPLKVKIMFTHSKVKVIVVSIYILVSASCVPTYFYTGLGWRFDSGKNRSMLGLTYKPNRAVIERVSYLINSGLSPLGYFSVILVSTMILVISLNRKTKWRQQISSKTNEDSKVTIRDQRVVKMVVVIATIFIAFLIPSNVVFVYQMIEPEFYIVGKYQNFFRVVVSFTLTMEAVQSSVNIVVYYSMSSNYRAIFNQLFQRKENS